MALEELSVLAAGYWLAESQMRGDDRRPAGWEAAAGFILETFHFVWQLLFLAGLAWLIQVGGVHLRQTGFVFLGFMLFAGYALSLIRRRPADAAAAYFLALMILTLTVQRTVLPGGIPDPASVARLLGGVLVCEMVLLGLKERLRWALIPNGVRGVPIALLCLALLAVIRHSFGL